MDRKTLAGFEVKDAAKGQISAVFATFNVVDLDGDVTLPGAFTDGAKAVISDYGHSALDGAMPVGEATIRQTDREAIFEGQYFMDTQAGRDAFTVVKRLGALNQFSYGYTAKEYRFGDFDSRRVRFLIRQDVHEVSPVVQGAAGPGNTRLLSAKNGQLRGEERVVAVKGAIRPHETDVLNEMWDSAAVLAQLGDRPSVSDLRAVAAWADPMQDPETKASYRFVHHAKAGGPANVRACFAGISSLNIGVIDLGDDDRQAVYDHLAGHIRDAEREAPALRAKGATLGLELSDEIAGVLVGATALLDSTDRVVALRAAKGKQLSKSNAEYLGWLDDSLMAVHRKLRSYLDSPDDEAVREYLRFVKAQAFGGQHGIPGSQGGTGEARR